jgi:hypothetical protein
MEMSNHDLIRDIGNCVNAASSINPIGIWAPLSPPRTITLTGFQVRMFVVTLTL